MDIARLPIIPHWNLSSCCVSTPDGGFLYIGPKTINYISKVRDSAAPIVKVFHVRQPILSLVVDPAWLNDGSIQTKYFAVLAQDTCVQIWDFDKGCVVGAHKGHFSRQSMEGNSSRSYDKVLISYMCNRNVLTLGSFEMIVYCVASNSFCRKPTFISTRKHTFTILSCSPYNENIFAVGTMRGLVLVCDLEQTRVLYNLRGHEASVTALSWTAVDKEALWSPPEPKSSSEEVNLCRGKEQPEPDDKEAAPEEKKSPRKDSDSAASNAAGSDDIFDIYDYDHLEDEFGAPSNNDKSSDKVAEFSGLEKSAPSAASEKFDFVEECQNLKEKIAEIQQNGTEESQEGNEVTLEDCQQVENKGNQSSSCGEGDSTEGSLELISRSSDEDVDVDGQELKSAGGLAPAAQEIVHTAEVHSIPVEEQQKSQAGNPEETIKQDSAHGSESKEQQRESAVPKNLNDSSLDASGQELHRDILLASAASDASYWIWNTETGGACDHQRWRICSPRTSGQHGKNTHVEIMWLKSTSFLTTNRMGEIILWNLLPSKPKIKRYKFKHDNTRKFLQGGAVTFSISPDCEVLWTISSYREISCESVETEQMIAKYSCSSTNVSAMRECPDDMNKIALALSDRRVGIIDLSSLSPSNVTIENCSTRIESPVLSLVWSPDSKKLAFGTIEGAVGVINLECSKPQTKLYHPFCGKPVYSMDWHENYIYAVCNETLGVYEDSVTNKDAEIIHSIRSISAISVRKEFLFVGAQNGHLQIYRRIPRQTLSFDLVHDLEISSRYITEIAWSPIAPERFAVVSMSNKICILEFRQIAGATTTTQLRQIEIKNAKASNACVKWSNRNANEFLTCSSDGAVRVWDLNCTTNDEKFLKQFHCPMTCGLFLPSNENIIMCGGKSTSVEFFDISVEKTEDYSQTKWLRSNANTMEHVKWAIRLPSPAETKLPTAAEKRRQRRIQGVDEEANMAEEGAALNVSDEVNGNICEQSDDGKIKEDLSNIMDSLKIDELKEDTENNKIAEVKQNCGPACARAAFMKVPTTIMYLTTKEINRDALDKLIYILSGDYKRMNTVLTAKLFSTKVDGKELLQEELRNYEKSESRSIGNLFMPQLQYNYKEEILKCIRSRKLTEWHVSLAPTLSYPFWRKCCQAFAEQLLEQGSALQAATYMLAIHSQEEAINMLLNANYFKEAMLIARVYVQPDNPILNVIPEKWVAYLDSTGNFTGAAFICALSGQMNRAYEILSKVRNTDREIERALKLLHMQRNEN